MTEESIEHFIVGPEARARKTPLCFILGTWHGASCWKDFRRHMAQGST
jgi:hypothetical protein